MLWEDLGLHAEIHGAQHFTGLSVVEDSLRTNEVQLRGQAEMTLQIPVLGLRLRREAYLDQVERAIRTLTAARTP